MPPTRIYAPNGRSFKAIPAGASQAEIERIARDLLIACDIRAEAGNTFKQEEYSPENMAQATARRAGDAVQLTLIHGEYHASWA